MTERGSRLDFVLDLSMIFGFVKGIMLLFSQYLLIPGNGVSALLWHFKLLAADQSTRVPS